jgi:hypothetical protein
MRDFKARLVRLGGLFVLVVVAMFVPYSACASRIKHKGAVFTGLDKITGRTIAFEAAAGETVQFGTLQITECACYTHPATEAPQTETFVQVDEVTADKQYRRIFSGWIFAASPGLHGIEHPIYDIWLTDCQGEGVPEASLEVPDRPPPAETEPTRPENSPTPKSSRRSRQGQPSEGAAPPIGEQTAGPPEAQPGAEPPSLGEPIEVAPPPGFIPIPRGGQRPPVQRDFPADPEAVPDPSTDDAN